MGHVLKGRCGHRAVRVSNGRINNVNHGVRGSERSQIKCKSAAVFCANYVPSRSCSPCFPSDAFPGNITAKRPKISPAIFAILGFHGDCDGKRTKWQSSAGRVLGSVLVDSCLRPSRKDSDLKPREKERAESKRKRLHQNKGGKREKLCPRLFTVTSWLRIEVCLCVREYVYSCLFVIS